MSAVADKLREARALVAEAWHQGSYLADAEPLGAILRLGEEYSGHGCCSLGAIGLVIHKLPDATDAPVDLLRRAIGISPISDERSAVDVENDISHWNDAPERTQAEVLAAFDKAIALAESEQ